MDFTRKTTPREIAALAEVLEHRLPPGGGEAYVAKVLRERAELVEAWRRADPEAAAEQSAVFHPLIPLDPAKWQSGAAGDPDAYYHNDVYTVAVRRHARDPVFGTAYGMIQLGISSLDGTARHDWRDLQAIKRQLAGSECEAFELYPAESRVLDPSNYYTLWCFPGVQRIKVGTERRKVRDAEEALAPQRQFSEGEKP